MKTTSNPASPFRAILPLALILLALALTPTHKPDTDQAAFFSARTESMQDGLVRIVERQGEKSSIILCTPEGATVSWRLVELPHTELTAHRRDKVLLIQGKMQGMAVDKELKIDKSPWFQDIAFSLQQMLRMGEQALPFWTLNPDTLALAALRAEQEGEARHLSGGKKVRAQVVRLRREGTGDDLWLTNYWFRASDARLLRLEDSAKPLTLNQALVSASEDML